MNNGVITTSPMPMPGRLLRRRTASASSPSLRMAQYEQDDDMLDGRSMGQFIILPDGKLLVVNGGKGMAAYSDNGTGTTTLGLAHPRYPDYHSTLLPDALVTIAESNPNPDIVMDALYPTRYRAEVFYRSTSLLAHGPPLKVFLRRSLMVANHSTSPFLPISTLALPIKSLMRPR